MFNSAASPVALGLALFLVPLSQPDPRAAAVLVDERVVLCRDPHRTQSSIL
jgi:hypothetical protein